MWRCGKISSCFDWWFRKPSDFWDILAQNNCLKKDFNPDKKISFLFLPEGEDPDTFVSKKGKEYFIKYSKKFSVEL